MKKIIFVELFAAEEEHYDLRGEDAQEHGERVYRRVSHSGRLLGASLIGVSQRRRVCAGSGEHTHDGEVIKLVLHSRYDAYDKDGDDCNEKSGADVFDTVALYDCLPEVCASLYAYAGEEEHESYLAEHEVGRRGGICDEVYAVSVASDEDGDDEGSACDTQLERYGHTRYGNGDTTKDDAKQDTDKNGSDIGGVKTLYRVSHQVCDAVDTILGTDDHNTVSDMEMVVSAGKQVNALARDTRYVDAVDGAEVHLAQCPAVHGGIGDDDALGYEYLAGGLFVPFGVYLRADEGLYGLGVGFGAHDEDFVTEIEAGVAMRYGHVAIMYESGADHVSLEKL